MPILGYAAYTLEDMSEAMRHLGRAVGAAQRRHAPLH
jgi:hypothetical protein